MEPLTDPAAHGGEARDAFHVVVPSIPGFGFSGKPAEPGWGIDRIAVAWGTLMERLGYGRYGAHGGDWGSLISARLGKLDEQRVAGIHLTMPVAGPDGDAAPLSEEDQARLDAFQSQQSGDRGYSTQQSTRPQTLGYGLTDSPAGQAAWIVEKFWAWTDNDGHPEDAVTRTQILDNLMLHWLPATAASSGRLYWESFNRRDLGPVPVPTGCSIFPREHVRLPRRWIERRFTDLRSWNELDRGGHFAAMEEPGLLVDELRAFFRLVR